MRGREMQKQISIFLSLSDWKAIRDEAARLRIPITEICRRWMHPQLDALRQRLGRGEWNWDRNETSDGWEGSNPTP